MSSACAHHAIFLTDLINTHVSKSKFRYGLMKCVWQSKKKLRGVSCFGIKKNVHDLWHQVDNDKDGDSMILT